MLAVRLPPCLSVQAKPPSHLIEQKPTTAVSAAVLITKRANTAIVKIGSMACGICCKIAVGFGIRCQAGK